MKFAYLAVSSFSGPLNMTSAFGDFYAIGPITVTVVTALIVLVVESLAAKTERMVFWVSCAGLIAAIVVAFVQLDMKGEVFSGMVTVGGYADFFAILFCLSGLLSVLLSQSYIIKEGIEHGEYYCLVLIAVAGMMLMAAAADLIMFFLGLEIMSLAFYVLAGFARRRATSNEAALKYFLLGAFATGFLLYGIALLYGSSGTTSIREIVARAPAMIQAPLFLIGLGLLLVGLAFKVAVVPFHMWVPDVYEGSPTTVSGFMSTGGKAAGFSVLLLIFAPAMLASAGPLRSVLAVVAALSMITGNVLAIAQNNIKRMLAYSSIAHAGYILCGVVAANTYGGNGILFYLLVYTAMNIGAFGVLSMLESGGGQNLTFDDYAGLSTKRPVIAALMAVFMFSLSGVPPFAGFFGKYYVFAGAVQAGYTWLAIVGVLMSVVSAYYYLRLVVIMYFKEQVSLLDEPAPALGMAALVVSAIALVGFGLFPSLVLHFTVHFF